MSLINDALKKAQRQRTEGSTPSTEISTPSDTQEPLHRVVRREKPAGFRSQLMLVGGGAAAAVLLLGIGAFFLFRPAAEQPAKVTSAPAAAPAPTAAPVAPVVAAPVAAVAVSSPVPATSASPAPATPPPPSVQTVAAVATPAPAPVETPTPAPAATAPASAPVAFVIPTPAPTASAPVVDAAPTAAAPATPDRPKPSTRMIGVIEHLKVGGIRVAGAESKVLMNDRVYRLNDVVDFELGIRLTAIEAKALTFEDARGAVHVRTF